MKALSCFLLIAQFANANPCNTTFDTKEYTHKGMTFDLYSPLKAILDQKQYIASQRRSPYRANIKIRIETRDDKKTYINSFYNLYRYRSHLIHLYEYKVCKETKCSRDEIHSSIELMAQKAKEKTQTCQ